MLTNKWRQCKQINGDQYANKQDGVQSKQRRWRLM